MLACASCTFPPASNPGTPDCGFWTERIEAVQQEIDDLNVRIAAQESALKREDEVESLVGVGSDEERYRAGRRILALRDHRTERENRLAQLIKECRESW